MTSGRPRRSSDAAYSATKVTFAPALDSALSVNWYPAIGTELDLAAMDWLELPDRIVKPVGVELFAPG
jgi:hypothetical protein